MRNLLRAGFLGAVLVLASTASAADQVAGWVKFLEKQGLSTANLKPKYVHYDFAPLLTPKNPLLGYIGGDFQRMVILFSSVKKSPEKPDVYLVRGASTVKGNQCDFEGAITITQVREYKKMHLGVDESAKDAGLQSEGILLGNVEFRENPKQPHSGIFKGVMTLGWFVDRAGAVHYDDIENYSDNYANNQYVTTWTDAVTKSVKVANWGEFRIPYSGDLDIGAGEFGPNPKYENKGWKGFR